MIEATLKKGYSIIELVIVMAIIGTLVGVVGPRFLSYWQRSKVSATEQTLRATQQAITSYYADTGMFPQTLTDLVQRPANVPVNKWFGYFQGKDEDYIPKDGWGTDLYYRLMDPRSKNPYELYSYGPNGESGDDSERIYAS